MTKRLSQLEQERQVRERRLARPYTDDWSEWDTKPLSWLQRNSSRRRVKL